MPKKKKLISCFTALDFETNSKLERLARTKDTNKSELLRMAIVDYMKRLDHAEASAEVRELALAEQLKKSTNRICGVLAKAAVDINAVSHFIWKTSANDGKDLYRECHKDALKRVTHRASEDEQRITDSMAG